MITISLCMIVKNEETTLERCLRSVGNLADEIIIADTGSVDATKETALRFTDKVYDFEWCGDFSAARNFSYEKATMDYILWLDADDIILPVDYDRLAALKQMLPTEVNAVMLRYNTGFDTRGGVIFSCFRERLTKRACGFKWHEPVHEYLETDENTIIADISITHAKPPGRQTGRNIEIYEDFLRSGGKLSTRGTYYFARELKEHKRYHEAIEHFRSFLDCGDGWVEDKITACGELASCYIALGLSQSALISLLCSFTLDTPRADICCKLGELFMRQEDYKQAIFWFELVFRLEHKNTVALRREDVYGYIPCAGLTVCYDRLGDYEKASQYNERTAQYRPFSPAVLIYRAYFNKRLKKE